LRKGASILELVIAIVVMGIAMMTLPLMLTTTQNNNIFAMRQEAIYVARTQLGDMLTYYWDEHSIDSNLNIGVLDTNSTNSNFERNSTMRRIGHVKGNKRRKYFASQIYATTPINLGKDINETTPNDIDDFNSPIPVTIQHIANTLDYRYDLSMTTTVSYVNDNFTDGTLFTFDINDSNRSTNIKMTKLTITNGADFNMTLRAYSCNIGANQLLRRNF